MVEAYDDYESYAERDEIDEIRKDIHRRASKAGNIRHGTFAAVRLGCVCIACNAKRKRMRKRGFRF